MTDTASTAQQPATQPVTGSTPQPITAEQAAANRQHDLDMAKQRLTFDVMATLLPVLNEQAPLRTLRYYISLAIDDCTLTADGRTLAQS